MESLPLASLSMDSLGEPMPPVLRDIHGIGGVPWWPPGPGWWLAAGALLLVALVVWRRGALSRLRRMLPVLPVRASGRWRAEATAALRRLRGRARAGDDPQACLGALSELLRRIAMARLGRPACAGLTGEAWLVWLAAEDPQGFPWDERGRVLLSAPYAPPGRVPGADLRDLIEAALVWVQAPPGRRRLGVPGLTGHGRV
jgi:hypothetical protein